MTQLSRDIMYEKKREILLPIEKQMKILIALKRNYQIIEGLTAFLETDKKFC